MIVNIIVAYCKNRGLGKNNTLVWNVKSDMSKFKKLTSGNNNNCVIMGRKTFESINNTKGLANRDNLILSKSLTMDKLNGTNIVKSFETLELLEDFVKTKNYCEVWIIGGAEIYELFLNNYKKEDNSIFNINEIIITYIDADFECDCFFPDLNYYVDKDNLYFYSKNITSNNNNDLCKQNYTIYEIIYKYK